LKESLSEWDSWRVLRGRKGNGGKEVSVFGGKSVCGAEQQESSRNKKSIKKRKNSACGKRHGEQEEIHKGGCHR